MSAENNANVPQTLFGTQRMALSFVCADNDKTLLKYEAVFVRLPVNLRSISVTFSTNHALADAGSRPTVGTL